jgi:hypothetical protein
LAQFKEKQKFIHLQEKEIEKQKIKQTKNQNKVTLPRRQSIANMMLNAMMPITNMNSNILNNSNQIIQYYYIKDGKQYGPVSEMQIYNSILSGDINSFTYLWKTGMREWVLANNFQEFQNLL